MKKIFIAQCVGFLVAVVLVFVSCNMVRYENRTEPVKGTVIDRQIVSANHPDYLLILSTEKGKNPISVSKSLYFRFEKGQVVILDKVVNENPGPRVVAWVLLGVVAIIAILFLSVFIYYTIKDRIEDGGWE